MRDNDSFTVTDTDVGKKLRKIRARTQKHLDLYARDGLRTLCIAKKVRTDSSLSTGRAATQILSFLLLFRRPLMWVALTFSNLAILTHHKDPGLSTVLLGQKSEWQGSVSVWLFVYVIGYL